MIDKIAVDNARQMKRLLKLLSRHGAAGVKTIREGRHLRLQVADRSYHFAPETIEYCCRQSLTRASDQSLCITPEGKATLLRMVHPDGDMRSQHMEITNRVIREDGESRQVSANVNESPLSRLHMRRDRNGSAWIDAYEFQAGERLRSDFEKAQLQPRVSANWISSVASGGRSVNTGAELSDFAIDARKRVELAMDRLGPELAGVALDVCCFLKGLETVEREHRWPPRSAKLMLRTALRELVRHYGLRPTAKTNSSRHWGAEDYRPVNFL